MSPEDLLVQSVFYSRSCYGWGCGTWRRAPSRRLLGQCHDGVGVGVWGCDGVQDLAQGAQLIGGAVGDVVIVGHHVAVLAPLALQDRRPGPGRQVFICGEGEQAGARS